MKKIFTITILFVLSNSLVKAQEEKIDSLKFFGVEIQQDPLPTALADALNNGGLNLQPVHGVALRWPLLVAPPDDLAAEIGISLALLAHL